MHFFRPRPSLLIFFAFVFLILPLFLPSALVLAQATQVQGHTASSGLVPCGAVPGSNYLVATECNLCDLTALIQRIINYLIVLAMPISAALFAWAGIILFTAGDDPGKRSQAKSIFKNVGIGLLIALSGFLVIQTLLNALVKGSDMFKGDFSFSFTCAADSQRPREGKISSLFTGLTGSNTLQQAPATPVTPATPIVLAPSCSDGSLPINNVCGDGSPPVAPTVPNLVGTITGVTSYQPGGGGVNGPDAFAFGPGKPYTVQDCLDQISGGATSCSQPIVVAATPDSTVAKTLKGTTLTWDQASNAYGLPAGTTYIVCDTYASGEGHGTFDVAVCHGGQTCRNNPNTAPSLNTSPTMTGTGSCSTAGVSGTY